MKIVNWLNHNLEKFLVSVLFMLFSGLMILNVLMILLTKEALSWASEAVLCMFVFFVWISVSLAFKERKHIKVNALVSLLPDKAQRFLEIAVNVIIILFFAFLVKIGIEWMLHPSVQNKHSLLLHYPMWIFYLSAPLGAFLSIIRIIQNTWTDIRSLRRSEVI